MLLLPSLMERNQSQVFQRYLSSRTFQDSIQNPFNISRSIFLGFDAVHIFKCLYTNRKTFVFPKFDYHDVLLEAKFVDFKLLYDIGLGKPLRKAYKLSNKVLAPINIENNNVMLADSIFHESIINGLRHHDKKEEYKSFLQTAELLCIIRKWFNTLNVKSFEARRSRGVLTVKQ